MNAPSDDASRIILAPLRGVTTRVYRSVFSRIFAAPDVALAPFILVTPSIEIPETDIRDVDPSREQGMPVIPQLIGHPPDRLREACRILADLGHGEVNWNLGCPYPFVMKKRRGAGLLRLPDMIEAGLDALCSVDGVSISVKTRLGIDRPDDLIELAPLFNRYPLREITIHPRVAKQMYAGDLDLDVFEQAADALRAPIVFNGGIRSRDRYHQLRGRFPGVTGWMIGRGLVSDPFLISEIRTGQSPDERGKRASIVQFIHELEDAYARELSGESHLLDRMKELWKYLAASFEGGERFAKKARRTHSLARHRQMVKAFLDDTRWCPGHTT